MKKGTNVLINIVLFAVVVFLAIKVIQSIQAPIKFGNEQKAREEKVIQRLIDINDIFCWSQYIAAIEHTVPYRIGKTIIKRVEPFL